MVWAQLQSFLRGYMFYEVSGIFGLQVEQLSESRDGRVSSVSLHRRLYVCSTHQFWTIRDGEAKVHQEREEVHISNAGSKHAKDVLVNETPIHKVIQHSQELGGCTTHVACGPTLGYDDCSRTECYGQIVGGMTASA